ncbi:MAG TPA: GDSL-type esterase/lipase family protein [Tepidisphaeraceae bacterium]|nr:GDSL-type esterase/lipase family protein [Tepidisphaeraceae bacterium]
MTLLKSRRVHRVLFALSLTLNVLLLALGAVHVWREGGLIYLGQKLGLTRHEFRSRPFQEDRLAFYRQLPNRDGGQRDVIFAGDSHIAGTPFHEIFSPIHNRGIGGDTTAGLLKRLDEITARRPESLFLLIGTNDVARQVPVGEVIDNYRQILAGIKRDSPDTRVFVASIPPVNQAIFKAAVDRKPTIQSLNIELKGLAAAEGATFIDLWPVLADGTGNLKAEFADTDGLHLNLAGKLAMCDALRPHVSVAAGNASTQSGAPEPASR